MSTAERIIPDEPVAEPQAEAPAEETPKVETPVEPEVPEKFKGKSPAEIARAYVELEKAYGRQGSEMGELRKWTDTLISNTKPSQETSDNKEEEIDFDLDPATATQQLIRKELANALKPLQEQAGVTKADQVRNALEKNHPGYEQKINDPAFANWVAASKVRTSLYQKADVELDYDSIDELLSTYDALHPVKTVDTSEREEKLKEATLETSSTGQISDKVYNGTDLIKLQINDPDAYEAQQAEIQQAYLDGRVK